MSLAHDFLNVFYGENDATNFSVLLFRLIAKADIYNLRRIEKGFPEHVLIYQWWINTPVPPSPKEVENEIDAIISEAK